MYIEHISLEATFGPFRRVCACVHVIYLSICLRLLRICSAVCLVVMCSCLLLLNYCRCLCFSRSLGSFCFDIKLVNTVLRGWTPISIPITVRSNAHLVSFQVGNVDSNAFPLQIILELPSSFAASKTQSDNCPESAGRT